MNARPLVIMLFVAWAAAPCGNRTCIGAEPANRETLETDKRVKKWIADRNSKWDSLLKDAEKVKEGLRLSASLANASVTVGTTVNLELCVRNVTELTSCCGIDRYHPTMNSFVLVRDQDGKPVPLTAGGLRRIILPKMEISSGMSVPLWPGDGFKEMYLLSDEFVLDKPGKYSVLVARYGGRGGAIVAKPLEFTVNSKDAIGTGKETIGTPLAAAPAPIVKAAPGGDEEWNTLLKAAGKEFNGCILDGVLSPYSPDAVHLVLSITCVRDTNPRRSWFEYHAEGSTLERGLAASNFRIMIHDSAGKSVPMTPFGREFFDRRRDEYPEDLRLNHSTGSWLPLDQLFCLTSGEEYTVIAALPEKAGTLMGLVSPPIRIRVPQLPVPGLTRPLYGSDEIWPRLIAQASILNPVLSLECKIVQSSVSIEPVGDPQITLRKRSGEAFGVELASAETTVLVRDGRGKSISPIALKDPADEWPDAAEWIRAKRWMDTTLFQPLDRRVESPAGSKAIATFPRFPDRYLIMLGEPYTIAVAIRLRGDHPAFVVAGPLTYVPSYAAFRTLNSDSHDPLPNPIVKPVPPIHTQWESLVRFAGEPFRDLVLTASEGARGELKVSLINQGKQSLMIKNWEGLAGYDVQVRNADGKPVPLTEKGKALFNGGAALDAHELKSQEKIEAMFSIAELFDLPVSGPYTVLASLPVIGEVDAVLTAKAIKMQLGKAAVPK